MKFRSGTAAIPHHAYRHHLSCFGNYFGFSFIGLYALADFDRTEEASWPVRAAEYAMARWHGRNPPGSS